MRQPLVLDEAKLENIANKAADKSVGKSKVVKQPATSRVIASTSSKWAVPDLESNFDLEKAKGKAFNEARYYMNGILNYDDLKVEMEWLEEDPIGHVKDIHTGKLVNSYDGIDLLKVYSQNIKERGIIVDGRV